MGDVSAGLGLAKTLAGLFALSTGGFAAPKRRRRADGGVNDLGDVDLGNEDASPGGSHSCGPWARRCDRDPHCRPENTACSAV